MPHYLLQAGNTPDLTLHEAKAVVDKDVAEIVSGVFSFSAENDQAAQEVFSLLGAAVRLVRVQHDWRQYSASELEEQLLEQLAATSTTKINFAVAQWGDQSAEKISLTALKRRLLDQQLKARFIEGPRHGLSAAVLLHQEVTELVVVKRNEELLLGKTLAVQDIDHWALKDREKPYANRKKGMLPPKVARAMVNIGLGKTVDPQTIVYDPFCGTGTVLIEALERGVVVAGSDLDEEAVVGAQTNLAWFADHFQLEPRFNVFRSQVSQAKLAQLPGKIDLIVTEPFLGKPTPRPAQLAGIFQGLEKLYLGAFNQWRTLLKNGAKIVMVLPRVEIAGGPTFDCQRLIDKLLSRGYTLQVNFGDIRYARKNAIVQRDIVVLSYSTNNKQTKDIKGN